MSIKGWMEGQLEKAKREVSDANAARQALEDDQKVRQFTQDHPDLVKQACEVPEQLSATRNERPPGTTIEYAPQVSTDTTPNTPKHER